MIVKKIIEKLRNKGYDDFYLADLADTHEGGIFFLVFFLQFLALAIPIAFVGFLFWGVHFFWGAEIILSPFVMWGWFCLFLGYPYFTHIGIKDKKKKGETDLRVTYIMSSKMSNIYMRTIRYAPVISLGLLVVCLIIAIIQHGIHVKIIVAFFISLLFLLFIARPYHRLLPRVMKEAVYYVDWKTHQVLDHFEERYSGYEKWRIPSSEMDFEQFNVWFFRNICQNAFVSVSIGCLTGLIYALSFSPMSCMVFNIEKTTRAEQHYEGPSIEEKKIIQTREASDESEDEIEGNVTQEDREELMKMEEKTEDEAEVIADETIVKEEIIGKEKEETAEGNNSQIEYFPLSLLDEMPTMSDGTAFKRGIVSYLKKEIPELEGKYAYVEFKISPEGKVVEVDASLVNDSQLQDKIRNSLLSMPNVNPGKKGGHAVYVKTNITVER